MRQSSINIVQIAIAVFAAVIIVAILLPNLGGSRPAPIMRNSMQLRGIHQGLVTYANSNKDWFPGINKLGEDEGITVESRFQILLEQDYITPEYVLSPSETEPKTEWEGYYASDTETQPVTSRNFSYAMLQIPSEGGRREEWHQTLNSQAIVLSDRNTNTTSKPRSIYTDEPGDWRGSVLWNDNHVGFENEDWFETRYGGTQDEPGELNPEDRLFTAEGTEDALMIHTGN